MLEICNVQKKYGKKGELVLRDVSLTADEGEIIAILGENGSGKTTMLKCILRLLEYENGEILYRKKAINSLHRNKFYKEFSAVLEGNRNLYWYMSAFDNIKYFGRLKKLSDKEIHEAGAHYLKVMGLYEERDKEVSEMSRGMQQKVAIVIALLGHPKIMLLDEPTLGLDVKSKNDLINCLRTLARDEKITILVTSHQMDVIEKLADRLVLLQDGKIAFDGKVMEFKEAYSQENYLIRVKGAASYLGEYYECVSGEEFTDIILKNTDYNDAVKVFDSLRENASEVLLFQKDVCSLEEILLNYKEGRL
ncbi:MAG: ABC transporter ATP-binding protein [Lachnospiraceae bacterium]|nr:ABC transporter ATP-binding protein [Lachnospiraceae bacterium]